MKKLILIVLSICFLLTTINAGKNKSYMLPINLLIETDNNRALLNINMYAELTPTNKQKRDIITDVIKDKIVNLIEKKSINDLKTVAGKRELQQELISVISKKLLYSRIEKIYFVKYEIQLLNIKKKRTDTKVVIEDAYPEFVNELYDNSLRYYKTWKETKKPKMYHKALFNIDSAITIEPNSSKLWFLKGMILSETKTQLQMEFALTSFIQAMIIEPKDYNSQLMVAQTLFSLGRYKEAIVRYKYIFKTYKKKVMDYTTLYPFAVSYIALNKKLELLKYIDEVLEEYDKNNTDIWIIWAVIHKNEGNKKHAIEILDWLIDISKDSKKQDYMKFLVAKYRGEK